MRTRIAKSSRLIGRRASVFVAFLFLAMGVHAQEASPISIVPEFCATNGRAQLLLNFRIPEHCHIYADRLSVEIAGQSAHAVLPEPATELDKHSGTMRGMYASNFVAAIPLASASGGLEFTVNLQACNDAECYFPETRQWALHPDHTLVSLNDSAAANKANESAVSLTSGFKITQRGSGYLGRREFLSFLDQSATGSETAQNTSLFSGLGAWATIGLILAGGLALNLTPCVLPMIPINLAILGAGVNGGNRRRGVALGTAYGLGMALAYGALGLVVVLTGSKFGTLNSSPWFNFAIAIVFIVLGLAMFDKIAIDLSRFQRGGGGHRRTGNAAYAGAAIMGAISALLAGACVAPVVISVLLLATTSYQQGNLLGLLFPFVLGLGMASPWPFAAGGLSFLPKPGRWMTRVKYSFGVLIFAFALWYGWLGWNVAHIGALTVSAQEGKQGVDELQAALANSRASGKPVLVDFWASWCKNCEAMEHTTLRDREVQDQLKNFEVVRFEAERLDDPAIKPVLDEFGVLGLPAFVVLRSEYSADTSSKAANAATNPSSSPASPEQPGGTDP